MITEKYNEFAWNRFIRAVADLFETEKEVAEIQHGFHDRIKPREEST